MAERHAGMGDDAGHSPRLLVTAPSAQPPWAALSSHHLHDPEPVRPWVPVSKGSYSGALDGTRSELLMGVASYARNVLVDEERVMRMALVLVTYVNS